MVLAMIRLFPLAIGALVFVYWIYALMTYDPNTRPCDGNCESCMFPSVGCEWKGKGSE